MNVLSVFVDESGDFGAYSPHSPFYLFSLVFHEQENNIEEDIRHLNNRIQEHGFEPHAIHTGPIIRNEGYYRNYMPEERKRIFNDLLLFFNKVNISYQVISVDKKEARTRNSLIGKLSKQLSSFLKAEQNYFLKFDKIIIYYDYGQNDITTILTSTFNALFNNVEFRHVQPFAYKLFQVADMICTLELSKLNYDNAHVSKSESNFYGSYRQFRDYYYKTIKKKRIK